MPIINKVLVGDTGGIQADPSTPTGSLYRAGSRIAADGKLYVTASGATTNFIGGIAHAANGVTRISQNAITGYIGGFPIDSTGAIVYTSTPGDGPFIGGVLVRDDGVFIEGAYTPLFRDNNTTGTLTRSGTLAGLPSTKELTLMLLVDNSVFSAGDFFFESIWGTYEQSALKAQSATVLRYFDAFNLTLLEETADPTAQMQIVVSVSASNNEARMMINGELVAHDTSITSSNISLANAYGIYCDGAGANVIDAQIAEVWYTGVYEDLDVETNRDKFWNSTSSIPKDQGSDGALLTGTAPVISFNSHQSLAAWNAGTNAGTGADFTKSGAAFTDV